VCHCLLASSAEQRRCAMVYLLTVRLPPQTPFIVIVLVILLVIAFQNRQPPSPHPAKPAQRPRFNSGAMPTRRRRSNQAQIRTTIGPQAKVRRGHAVPQVAVTSCRRPIPQTVRQAMPKKCAMVYSLTVPECPTSRSSPPTRQVPTGWHGPEPRETHSLSSSRRKNPEIVPNRT